MNPLTVAIVASGGILGALAVSANQRSAKALASARVLDRQPAATPPAPQLPASTIPSHAVDLNDGAQAQPMARAPRVAAQDLYNYVTELVRADRGAELGSASKPNATVRDAQRDMKLVTADGIYGTKTRARGKELLGREFPARESKTRGQPLASSTKPTPAKAVVIPPHAAPAVVLEHAPAAEPPPPSQPVAPHSPRESAEAMYVYVSAPSSDLGSKKKPNATIRAAQKAMGGLTADGIYGPKTRARIHTLTGRNPPR
jgi:peptidoglycan hydrolase-like protein with peptidoglycan-binding domain